MSYLLSCKDCLLKRPILDRIFLGVGDFRFLGLYIFVFIPQPAEYGAEELALDAVAKLGLVRDALWV